MKTNPPSIKSSSDLREMQRLMATALFRPLTPDWGMQKKWIDGAPMDDMAERLIKPNDRLTSFERLEIYNRQYWYRVLDCLHDDYPGLRALLGERRFLKLSQAYLVKYPSGSYTLRDLGSRLGEFLRTEPRWCGQQQAEALAMVQFEWAQIVAFDGPTRPGISMDDLLDESPADIRLDVQPYITLLDLNFAVDDYFSAVRKREGNVLRGETSNAVELAPRTLKARTRLRPPRAERTQLAVHRFENQLYYKRLEPAAYLLLSEIRAGRTLEAACLAALGPEPTAEDAAQIQEWFRDWAALGWFCPRDKKSKS